MDLMFNELSMSARTLTLSEANRIIEAFVHTIVEANKSNRIKKIRYCVNFHEIYIAENYSLQDWLHQKNTDKNLKDLIYSTFTYPFISEDDEYGQSQFVENNFLYTNGDNGIKQACLGLASAYLSDAIAISLQTDSSWKKNIISMYIENPINSKIVDVLNVFSKDCFITDDINSHIGRNTQPELVASQIEPDEKKIHLADHHGKAELSALCQRLKNNPYIVEMRSMEWCRGNCNKFIKKFNKHGVIELVLTETDRKYGLWVQTTGRTYWETAAIAKLITEIYS